ncbi:hypothetical protein GGR88_001726 [Sphingomonas jejuensis]|jgi:hypothetical protein|uniref:Uncharacterized protein n=1 Tax=Sphingomonas jejuensis TaxID=904715 RepID=A0ABX0XN08_9SPHN|nr:hypothetical protein [Sphingomonas jejuensis]NJC34252.1 hypothetical protein [Sphingomonas jejuensis]
MSMLALLLYAQPATLTAEDAMRAHRQMTAATSSLCPEARGAEEVVVCARNRDSQYRLPYPALRGPPDRRIPGEILPVALDAEAGSCGTVGQGYGCNGGLDVLGIAAMVVTRVVGLIEGTDPPPIPPPPE